MKKKFNLIEVKKFKKILKNKLSKYTLLSHQYRFLKLFQQEFYFVGNIRNVKKVFLIPYNTKRGYIWPTKKYYPFNIIKDGRVNIIARFIPVLIAYFMSVILLLFSFFIIPYTETSLLIVQYSLILFMMPLVLVGVGSKNNEASQDASMRFAFEMLENMDAQARNHIGFIFMDTSKRQTSMKAMNDFFKHYNKSPLVIEPIFFSNGTHIGIASNRFEMKLAQNIAKKYRLEHTLLQPIPEYYAYKKYIMISYGDYDKDNDLFVKYTLKNKEHLQQSQYDVLKQILQQLGSE